MKILLLHPSNRHVWEKIQKTVVKLDKSRAKAMPIGIMYLAAVLEINNYEVTILDAEAANMSFEDTVAYIQNQNPDILGITTPTALFNASIDISKRMKEHNREIKVVLGGPHISAMPKESLVPEPIDFIVTGEGENSFLELIRTIEQKSDYSGVKGIGYKKDGQAVVNPSRELILNLDDVPFPARNLVDTEKYLNLYTGEKHTIMVSSRGCPYHCIFCDSHITFGHRVRFRTPDNVIDEIKEVVGKYNIGQITFSDDTFTINKERTIEICRKIVENRINVSFICASRVNTIDEDRLQWLKRAGCSQITFGIESGNNDILKILKKGITVDQARHAVRITKKSGIETHASYIIGVPGESLATIDSTIKLAKELATDYAQFCIATPLPGTELWDIAKRKGLINTTDFSQFSFYYSPLIETDQFDMQQLIKIQKEAYESYKSLKQGK